MSLESKNRKLSRTRDSIKAMFSHSTIRLQTEQKYSTIVIDVFPEVDCKTHESHNFFYKLQKDVEEEWSKSYFYQPLIFQFVFGIIISTH